MLNFENLVNIQSNISKLPNESADMCIARIPDEYNMDILYSMDNFINLFNDVYRILSDDGTLWLYIGDSYLTSDCDDYKNIKSGDLIGIPWMIAFSLRSNGWYLRQDVICNSDLICAGSYGDICTLSHKYMFMFSKNQKYHFDHESIQEIATGYDGRKDTFNKGSHKYNNDEYMPDKFNALSVAARPHERWKFKNLQDKGQQVHTMHIRRADGYPDVQYPVRNKRDVWGIDGNTYKESDYFECCILSCCEVGGTVLDLFNIDDSILKLSEHLGRECICGLHA